MLRVIPEAETNCIEQPCVLSKVLSVNNEAWNLRMALDQIHEEPMQNVQIHFLARFTHVGELYNCDMALG